MLPNLVEGVCDRLAGSVVGDAIAIQVPLIRDNISSVVGIFRI